MRSSSHLSSVAISVGIVFPLMKQPFPVYHTEGGAHIPIFLARVFDKILNT